MTTTRSQTNSEFESIAITDSSGLVIGLDVEQLAVADVANLTIPGGTAGQVLSTDGNGTLSWAPATSASVQVATQASETFTATAQQTQFTLARVASGTVTGSINGVTAAATAFTVSGSTVTYVPAQNGAYPLKAGDRITLSYLYGATSASSLDGLADVTITSPAAGQVLAYDAGTSAWINQPGATAFGELVNGTSNVTVAADGNVTVSVAGNANIATFTGTSFVSSSNVALSGANVSLGAVANLKITGGSNAQVMTTDGAGTLSFTTPSKLVTLAYSSTVYAFPGSFTPTTIKYETKIFDPQSLYDIVTGRFQPKVAGWYQISAGADCFSSSTTQGSVTIGHSTSGNIGMIDGFGLVSAPATGVAYYNGTTDYAFVFTMTSSSGSRTQNRQRSSFSAMFLSI